MSRCLLVLALMLLSQRVVRSQDLSQLISQRSATEKIPGMLTSATYSQGDDDHDAWRTGQSHTHNSNDVPGGFFEELFDRPVHTHFSSRGTPLVHLFLVEPAVLHRDFFLDYRLGNNVDGNVDEQELEGELEWAVTKRLGLILEAPYLGLDPVDSPNTSGFGDISIAGRALLVARETFFLSGNVGVGLPTGNVGRSLGRGEATLSSTFTSWHDLGNWVALHTQFGTEVGLQSGDAELIYGLAITRSFLGPVLFSRSATGKHDEGDGHMHAFPPGFTSLILELTGSSGLSGEETGQTFFELLPGISYTPVEHVEMRFGVRFPLFRPERLDSQYIFTIGRAF